ncbi:SDR family NAD(P)-dependent oxidoreductase [Streptococcus merionis]|uniref:SDR family NAD(P)-dependent oxidoreductase n=1 Tax=Streptococcus merionis TaxID=400065 RepID=UPI0026F0926A|nr:SDR family NAD(P)-dependent oxidoreductase [Streptococcus merionis]
MTERKLVVISGGTAGIGRELSLSFARRGYNIVFLTHNVAKTEEFLRELRQDYSENFDYLVCEITKEADLASGLAEVLTKFGQINVFVNNAGYGPSISGYPAKKITELTGDTWDMYLDNCLKGIFFSVKIELTLLQEQGFGVIINTALERVDYKPKNLLYAVAKDGIAAITKTAQATVEEEPDISVHLLKGNEIEGKKEWERIIASLEAIT